MKLNGQKVEKTSQLWELYYFIKYLWRYPGILRSVQIDWASELQSITVYFVWLTVMTIKTPNYQETDHFFKEKFNNSLSLRQVEMNSGLAPLGKRKAGLSGIVTLILSTGLTGSTGSSPIFADLFYETDEFLSPSLSFSSAWYFGKHISLIF